MIGFPNENLSQINDTIKMAISAQLDWYTVQLLTPLPSTEIYDEMVAAATNLVYASGAFTFFTWFRAFEADQWKNIYQSASDNMASYISAKQRSQED